MGMAEEFDELTAKVLKQEMQDGICAKIVLKKVVLKGQLTKKAISQPATPDAKS